MLCSLKGEGAGEVVEVEEGHEPEGFWEAIGGKQDYPKEKVGEGCPG